MHRITGTMITEFVHWLRNAEHSQATIEKYQRDLAAFFLFLSENENIAEDKIVTKESIILYKEHLISRYAVSSINSMLAAINTFLTLMGWTECKVKPIKTQRRVFCAKEKELTKEEYMRLLSAARGKANERLCLVVETICATGIRVSELCFITVESIQQGCTEVQCKGKSRTVFLPQKLCMKLKKYVRQKELYSGSVFVTKSGKPLNRSNIWHDMKALSNHAGVPQSKVFPHNLRHLFARTHYSMEKDLGKLADLLGHSNIETTRIYTVTTGVELKKQVALLGLVV